MATFMVVTYKSTTIIYNDCNKGRCKGDKRHVDKRKVPSDDDYIHHTKVFVNSGKEFTQDNTTTIVPLESQGRMH
eukprot:2043491-Ditylum_brightwellii.AAC.1